MSKAVAPLEEAQKPSLICMAEIVGVHGIKGAVKLKLFGDNPAALTDYAPLCDAQNKHTFKIISLHAHGNTLLAEFEGVKDRTAAEKLRGTKLYLSREYFPEINDGKTFYHADLIGLAAVDTEGTTVGKIVTVANFGAGDLLEVKPLKGASYFLPFTDACVPHVDLAARKVTIAPPPGLLD